ncbi:hypothetical protein ABPG75_009413 [Micractinium tetrahymenae]
MARPGDPFPADSFLAAAGSNLHLLRRQQPPPNGGGAAGLHFGEVLVAHSAPLSAACWNRNNKVVAAGSTDGSIQLLYAGGTVMGVLPQGDTAPLGPITSLSWSVGSKRLAAGSGNGSVYIHDIPAKSMATLSGHPGGVHAVEFQHEDKFMAVACGSGSVVLYNDPFRPGAPALPLQPSATDGSARLCLSLAASGDAAIAAGSAQGGVAVWDAPTRRLVEEHPSQHGGSRVNALSFVPLRPDWLYSAGADGRVCLQDRKSGPGHVSVTLVGAPATSLMVREDHTMLGVGTADGVVKLYDPRNTRQPVKALRLQGGPVASLHWQHRFLSLSRQRAAAAPAGAGRPAAAPAAQPAPARPPAAAASVALPAAAPAPSIGSQIPAVAAAAAGDASTAGEAALLIGAAPTLAVPHAVQQPTPHSRPVPTPAAAAVHAGPALAVTPLTGPARRFGTAAAPAPGDFTPAPAPGGIAGLQQHQEQQQLSSTPLSGHCMQRGAAGGVHTAAAAGAPPGSPLELLAAAPMSLDVTPLLAPPPGRHLAAAGTTAPAARAGGAPPPPLNVSPLSSAGSLGDGRSSAAELCVSPLPGMAGSSAASPAAASPQQQRNILGERSTNSGAGGGLAPTAPRLLPGLAPPLPAVGLEDEESQLHGSPSFAENVPLPSPAGAPPAAISKQQQDQQQAVQQPGCLAADEGRAVRPADALKLEAAGAAVSRTSVSPTSSGGSPQRWAIGTLPAAQQHEQPPPAATPAPSATEFSFAVAERQQQQLGASAEAWSTAVAGICQAGPAVTAAAAASGAPLAGDSSAAGPLRDELLAMHLDMLTQFQAQQACMGELVGKVLERNEALSGEVAALRRQLAALTTRRDELLWL